jgi:hypothetical protein
VERLEGEKGVHADAEHLRLGLFERGHPVTESTQFLRTDRAEGGGKERQDDRAAAQLAEGDRLTVLIDQRKIRRDRSDVCRHAPSI